MMLVRCMMGFDEGRTVIPARERGEDGYPELGRGVPERHHRVRL